MLDSPRRHRTQWRTTNAVNVMAATFPDVLFYSQALVFLLSQHRRESV
jgi:hypothetical protein